MRKLKLLAAVAGIAMCGSVANADFIISSTRSSNAFTIGTQSYDIVTFKVTNDGNNGTGTKMTSLDVALQAPTSIGSTQFPGNGMLLASAFGEGDVFGTDGAASGTHASFIKGAGLTSVSGPSVLLNGAVDTSPYASSSYTDQQVVSGISGTIFSTVAFPPANVTPYTFAQAAVPTGMPVEVLNPNAARTFEPNSGVFLGVNADNSQSAAGSTVAANLANGPFIDGVPEPSSFALFGIGAAGLLARRRRTA